MTPPPGSLGGAWAARPGSRSPSLPFATRPLVPGAGLVVGARIWPVIMCPPQPLMLGSLWSAATGVRPRDRRLEPAHQRTEAADGPVRPSPRRRPAAILGVFFLSLYLLTMGGHF